MNRLMYTSSDEDGLVPAKIHHGGALFEPILWVPGAVFARAAVAPAGHVTCCRQVLRLSLAELKLADEERTAAALDALLGQAIVRYKLAVWPRAVGWVGAVYGVRGAYQFMADDLSAWSRWSVPGPGDAELEVRAPNPTWIKGTSLGTRYHVLARTHSVIVAARFVALGSGKGAGLRLRIEAPGDSELLDHIKTAGNPLGWATYNAGHYVSAEPRDKDSARVRIAGVIADALRLEEHA